MDDEKCDYLTHHGSFLGGGDVVDFKLIDDTHSFKTIVDLNLNKYLLTKLSLKAGSKRVLFPL